MPHKIFSFEDSGDPFRMPTWICVDNVPQHGPVHVHLTQVYTVKAAQDPDDYCDKLKTGDQVVLTVKAFMELAKEVGKVAQKLTMQTRRKEKKGANSGNGKSH